MQFKCISSSLGPKNQHAPAKMTFQTMKNGHDRLNGKRHQVSQTKQTNHSSCISLAYMAVGTGGGQAEGNCPPPIFCQPKKFKSLKITTYKSVYINKDKIGF